MLDKQVYSVLRISLTILKTFPITLKIVADGQTRTGGYTNVRLEPRLYLAPPIDGVYEFDFVAMPPSGPATTVITPAIATYLHKLVEGVKGIRVYAETNKVTKMLVLQNGNKVAETASAPDTARGYSDKYDLGEAMQNAIAQLSRQAPDDVDHLSHYVIVDIGAEIGGIIGMNRLYVDVKGQ